MRTRHSTQPAGFRQRGLKTKEDVTARRDLVAKALAANNAYLEFVKTQEATFRAELVKTPLTPNDVDAIAKDYFKADRTATTVKLREKESDVLKAGDDMLAFFDKRFGSWTVNDAGKISFKKKADGQRDERAEQEIQRQRRRVGTAASTTGGSSGECEPNSRTGDQSGGEPGEHSGHDTRRQCEAVERPRD